MHVLEKAVIDLLRGYLDISNDKIFTGGRYKPIDVSPCVTVQQASEVNLSGNHMPGATESIKLKYDAEVWINVWCDTDEQRDSLVEQIELRIFQALSNHYTTCAKYNEGNCDFLEDECATLNVTNGRTAKNQCPYPNEYGYCNWFKKNQIIKRTFAISGKQKMDELNLSKPILRTLIKLEMNYYKLHEVGGHAIGNLIVDEDLL